MNTAGSISATDRKIIRKSVESVLTRYRLYKYLTFEEREATVTASYEAREGSGSNKTSDQTATIAIHNVDGYAAWKAYCERVERAVKRLPRMERFLIEERYMGSDSEYITDYSVYCHKFDPPISEGTYSKIRQRAMQKLYLLLGLAEHK